MVSMVGRTLLLESPVLALVSPQAWVLPVVAVAVQQNSTPEIPMHSVLMVPMVMSVLPLAVVVVLMGMAVVVPSLQVVVQEVALA